MCEMAGDFIVAINAKTHEVLTKIDLEHLKKSILCKGNEFKVHRDYLN